MKTLRIAVYPGDGIGPEVMGPTLEILAALERASGDFQCELHTLDWGVSHWRRTGQVVPDDFLEVLRPHDAILLGAVGWPAEVADHVTLAPLVTIRQRFDQYACMRPVRLYPGVTGPLAGKGPQDIDLVVIRENSEGEYVDAGGRFHQGSPEEFAWQTGIHTRRGIERILRFGFRTAQGRRKRLTMVTKSNAMRYGYVLWDEILEEVADEFPDVTWNKQHADAAAMNFVRCPETFDVVVASNLFGDLLTDLGGIIGGGLGLAPSTNTNPTREYPSMFEPVHGSAPDIAGQGIANPTAAILSLALMLEWLELPQQARHVREAVARALADGCATPDLGGSLTTQQMGDAVRQRLGNG
jgi:tartrate dehydrogenase/decarboxylase/D-malate dehydrogenase